MKTFMCTAVVESTNKNNTRGDVMKPIKLVEEIQKKRM
jgi:hypothetical protein